MKNIEGLEAESRVDILLWSEWFYSFFQGLQRQILDAFNGINQVEEKAPADYVGELDKSIERGLFDFLPKVYDCPVLSEETPSPWPPAFRKFWIIDSLDGTHNFLAGLPIFGTIVALVAGGKAVFSAIYLPMDEQSYGADFMSRLKATELSEDCLVEGLSLFRFLDKAIWKKLFFYWRVLVKSFTLSITYKMLFLPQNAFATAFLLLIL